MDLHASWPSCSTNLTLCHSLVLPLPNSTRDESDHACLHWSDVLLCYQRLSQYFDWGRSAPACCWRTYRGRLAWPREGKSAHMCRCSGGLKAWNTDRWTRSTRLGPELRIGSHRTLRARSADGFRRFVCLHLPFFASCLDKSLLRAAGNDHRRRVEELCRDNRFPSRTSARSPLANSLHSSLLEGQSYVAEPTHQSLLPLYWGWSEPRNWKLIHALIILSASRHRHHRHHVSGHPQ